MANDTETGVTIMQMDAGLDTGAMLLSRSVAISDQTTAGELHDVLANLGGDLILEALSHLAQGALNSQPQPQMGVTYAAKIDKAEAKLILITMPKPSCVKSMGYRHSLARGSSLRASASNSFALNSSQAKGILAML